MKIQQTTMSDMDANVDRMIKAMELCLSMKHNKAEFLKCSENYNLLSMPRTQSFGERHAIMGEYQEWKKKKGIKDNIGENEFGLPVGRGYQF